MIIYFLNLLIINWFEIFLRFRLCTQLLYSPYAALCINSLHINNNEIIVCKYSNIDNILPIHSWKLADNNPNCTGKNCENFFSFFPEFVIRAFFLKPPYLKKRANFYDNLREKKEIFWERNHDIFSLFFSVWEKVVRKYLLWKYILWKFVVICERMNFPHCVSQYVCTVCRDKGAFII